MNALRRNEVMAIAGAPRFVPLVLNLKITPSMAARLDLLWLQHRIGPEQFILDLLDDALPAPSREQSTSRE